MTPEERARELYATFARVPGHMACAEGAFIQRIEQALREAHQAGRDEERDALHERLQEWRKAYDESIFPPRDLSQYDPVMVTAVSGRMGRHILDTCIGDLMRSQSTTPAEPVSGQGDTPDGSEYERGIRDAAKAVSGLQLKVFINGQRQPDYDTGPIVSHILSLLPKAPGSTTANARDAIMEVVNEQADDDGLWSVPFYGLQPIAEAHLQQELRRLHAVIERAYGVSAGTPKAPVAPDPKCTCKYKPWSHQYLFECDYCKASRPKAPGGRDGQ